MSRAARSTRRPASVVQPKPKEPLSLHLSEGEAGKEEPDGKTRVAAASVRTAGREGEQKKRRGSKKKGGEGEEIKEISGEQEERKWGGRDKRRERGGDIEKGKDGEKIKGAGRRVGDEGGGYKRRQRAGEQATPGSIPQMPWALVAPRPSQHEYGLPLDCRRGKRQRCGVSLTPNSSFLVLILLSKFCAVHTASHKTEVSPRVVIRHIPLLSQFSLRVFLLDVACPPGCSCQSLFLLALNRYNLPARVSV